MTETLSHRFAGAGYVSPVPVFTPPETDAILSQLLAAEARFGGHFPPAINVKAHLLFPFLWDLIQDPRIVEPVAQILGPDLLCWGSSFFSKDAGTDDVVPWHQDGTCWGLDAPRALTAWLALTPSTPEMGCLRVLPGSHETPVRHAIRNAPSSMLPLGEEVALEVDEAQVVDCPLRPGEMSLHHVMLVHGSHPNRAPEGRRIGFAIRYIAGDVAQRHGKRGFASLVRGRDHRTYELEQRPEKDLAPDALRRHRAILSHTSEIVRAEAAQLDLDDA